jgi:hypothetical protein
MYTVPSYAFKIHNFKSKNIAHNALIKFIYLFFSGVENLLVKCTQIVILPEWSLIKLIPGKLRTEQRWFGDWNWTG